VIWHVVRSDFRGIDDDVREALEAYRVHPDHLPVVARVRELGIGTVRLDVATDDDVGSLP
jgi:hypothetical protein